MKQLTFILTVVAAALGCNDDAKIDHTLPVHGEYMPLIGTKQSFLREELTSPQSIEPWFFDTIQVASGTDLNLAGKNWQTLQYFDGLEFNDNYKIFRRNGSQYLRPPLTLNGEDVVFLDLEKAVGETWQYWSGSSNDAKIIFIVKSIDNVRTVNGLPYENTIEMQMDVFAHGSTGWYLVSSENTIFAKDVGEILSNQGFYTYTGALRISRL